MERAETGNLACHEGAEVVIDKQHRRPQSCIDLIGASHPFVELWIERAGSLRAHSSTGVDPALEREILFLGGGEINVPQRLQDIHAYHDARVAQLVDAG